jgi:pimeloyl-ACP methyl ester carboxylesterase
MSLLPNPKTLTLPETPHHHYTYHHTPPTNPSLPTLLFLHGFPSSAYDFRHQITHLSSQGYGILAPDLLGYNGTSQPLDVTAYSMPKMAHEIIQLLNHENLDTVVGISHDWGSALLSTLLRHYAERFRAFVFIATYYAAAHPYSTDREFNYEKLRDDTVPKFGFNAFGHVAFLGQAEKAGKVLDTDDGVESFFDLTYAREQGLWREVFRKEGGIEAWVGEGRRTEVAAWIGGEEVS